MHQLRTRCFVVLLTTFLLAGPSFAADKVGVASVDITPTEPIRLNGFGFRRTESEGVTHPIYAKALAFQSDDQKGPAILIAIDTLGIPDAITQEIAQRLEKKAKLDPTRLAITATHTHTGPMLTNLCPTIFGTPITAEEQAHIDTYTKAFTDKLEEVALAALNDLKPAKLEWGVGEVNLSINRRTKGGPVDHDMPLLAVRDPDGKLRAIYISYACHCVTLSHNKISGDWAGYAAELVAKNHPGSIALTSIGCAGDSNPASNPVGDRPDIAQAQGKQLADEVERLLKQGLTPISGNVTTALNKIIIPFDTIPSREQFTELAKRNDAVGYHAKVQLAKLDRGEKLQTELPYTIGTWTFGKDQLAMVFLAGEVVVDYSTRLKHELDRSRLWINAYSNDVPCYIPSERILKEGGYEGGGAMIYYDRPTKLAAGLEQKIIDEVHRQLPDAFEAPKGTEGVAPKSADASLRAIRTKPNLEVELVASEPLINSPVAIDWGLDGRLWVCEMADYPTGADGNWKPGGRVVVLSDTDHDGKFDKSTLFIENIPFPTGVTAWGKGAFICTAPDILYAEDTDDDGKADKIEKRFTGFSPDNFQARVNSISLGLDNWLYVANGLLGGNIKGPANTLDIRNHDFRFNMNTGTLELVTGITQQGRVRDDWGRWFGCDNSTSLWQYPHEMRYLVRNPNAPAPPQSVSPKGSYDVGRVYPISQTLERFNNPQSAGHVTSGCGLGIYRDTLIGDEYYGNAFTCEPVHNLVTRMILHGDETVTRSRAADEHDREFFASTDNWSRFVQARTGPDGALYVVDMYRFLIEHPRWIPAERLAKLDVRAGASMGRIYRVKAKDKPLREVRDLTKLSAQDLASTLMSPNGTERDRAHQALLLRNDPLANGLAENAVKTAPLAQSRVQALSVVDRDGVRSPEIIRAALKDPDPHVRARALRMAEHDFSAVGDDVLGLLDDPSPIVRHQLAYSLGEWNDPKAAAALAKLATSSLNDAEMRIAVLSSATRACGEILSAVMSSEESKAGRAEWIAPLLATAAASKDPALRSRAILAVLPDANHEPNASHLIALASFIDSLKPSDASTPELKEVQSRAGRVIGFARKLALDTSASDESREAALAVLGRGQPADADLPPLCGLAGKSSSDRIRSAAQATLRRQSSDTVAKELLTLWPQIAPGTRPEIVNLLISRENWTLALLDAMKRNKVQPNEIALADRQQLLASQSDNIKKLAAEVFPAQPASSRTEIIRKYASVHDFAAAPASGAELFAKNCAPCHLVQGVGHDIGPNLIALRDKDADYFVKNILDPSAVVEPRFVNYIITMKDDRMISGVIKAETATNLTVASGGNGVIETLTRSDVKTIRATNTSMMPEGFEAALPPQQMADLIAFLRSSSAPRKEMPGNTPVAIKPGSDGALFCSAAAAEIYGGQNIRLETDQFNNIGWWSDAGDYVAWTIEPGKSGEFDIYLDYAAANDAAGNSYAIDVDGKSLTGAVAVTGSDWSAYQQLKVGSLHLDAGRHRLVVKPGGPIHGALMDLRAVALVPGGTKPKWPKNAVASAAPGVNEMTTNPVAIAQLILDPSRSDAARTAVIGANPQFAADIIAELTKDLPDDLTVEYKRIPWIWRVAIECGKRNEPTQIRRVIDVSLPKAGAPLRDWEAVVLGGGIINGVSQLNLWPGDRISEIIGDDVDLKSRWQHALDEASTMADNEKVHTGTRYDALRMLGVESWSKRGEQLKKYLTKDTNAELQMGAVSALVDVKGDEATKALEDALPNFTEKNRELAQMRKAKVAAQ
jgi:putative membrane-bound dehydrogenase-like protein